MVRRRRRSGECRSKASSPAPLPRGAEVEVRLDSEGFHGSWYEATVADFAPARNGRRVCDYYTAAYSHLLADDGCTALTDVVPSSQVRPRPPPPPSESSSPPPRFRLYDIVEAFHFDGWWTGIVMSTLDSSDPDPGASASDTASASVTVGFPITRDVIELPAHLVRPRRDYVDGHWVPSRAAMAAPSYKLRVYEVGEKVEVGRYRDLYGYSWFPATVLTVVDELSYVVDYGEGKATAAGTEYVHWQFIRPALEHFCRDSESELQLGPGNEVEVYCGGAWSLGEVDSVIRGKWKYKVIVGNKKEYMLVTKVVELLKPVNNWNNWIGNQRRIVAAKRPSANLRRVMSEENPRSPVDLTCNGDTDVQHGHDPESPATKRSRKNLKQLDGILAEGSECSPHCSLVMGIPLSDQNRNDHMCTDHSAAQVAKSNRVMETAIASLDYPVQHAVGKVDQHADGKMDRHADGKVDGSSVLLCLQNAGISQSTMDSSPLRSCSASESMLPSPLALSLSRSPNNCSGNRRRIAVAKRLVNLRTPSMSCENPSSPVDVTSNGDENSHDPETSTTKKFPINSSPLRSCSASESLFPSPLADGKPLFVKSSPMWPQIEAMDVFNVYPQRPHFLPLREFPPAMHEGMALGLTSVLPNLVMIMRKASIDNSMEWFEGKFSTLRHLERHGFSVQSLHSTLTKLVKIKSQQSICLGEMDKLDVEIEVETASLTRMGALLDEKDSAIAELEQKLGALRQETQKIAAEMETKVTKLSRFKSQQSRFKEAYGDAKREFRSVLAALPGSA